MTMRTTLVIFCLLASTLTAAAEESLLFVADLSMTVPLEPNPAVTIEPCLGLALQKGLKKRQYASITFEVCPVSSSLSLSVDWLFPVGPLLIGPYLSASTPYDGTPNDSVVVAAGLEVATCSQSWLCPALIASFGGDVVGRASVPGMFFSFIFTPPLVER